MEEFWSAGWRPTARPSGSRDWSVLADHYAEDATYGWMYTPDEHFMAVGREEIREHALGTEMAGLDGWHYDYAATVMDERNGMVVGFWKQRAGIEDDDRQGVRDPRHRRLAGSGSGAGRHDGWDSVHIAWQRDWFDLGSTAHTFLALAGSGKAPQPLLDRMSLDGPSQPGHYRHADLPSTRLAAPGGSS